MLNVGYIVMALIPFGLMKAGAAGFVPITSVYTPDNATVPFTISPPTGASNCKIEVTQAGASGSNRTSLSGAPGGGGGGGGKSTKSYSGGGFTGSFRINAWGTQGASVSGSSNGIAASGATTVAGVSGTFAALNITVGTNAQPGTTAPAGGAGGTSTGGDTNENGSAGTSGANGGKAGGSDGGAGGGQGSDGSDPGGGGGGSNSGQNGFDTASGRGGKPRVKVTWT